MMYTIYKATNVLNNYCYIGQTVRTLDQRKYHHLYDSRKEKPKYKFHKSLKEIGYNNFIWNILDTTNDRMEADKLERFYISEYNSIEFGYNVSKGGGLPVPGILAGSNNPRYGDHRTWIELHGVEKAEQLRQQQIKNFTGHKGLSEAMTKRLSVWNPMDNPESREKVRQSKLGIKNPQAIYDYYFTKEDGTEIKVECLREYCKEHPDIRRASIITAAKTGKKYKNMFIRKVLKNGRINRNNAPS